jgi:hypothetical protein
MPSFLNHTSAYCCVARLSSALRPPSRQPSTRYWERRRPPYNTTSHSNTCNRPEWLEPHMQVIPNSEAQPIGEAQASACYLLCVWLVSCVSHVPIVLVCLQVVLSSEASSRQPSTRHWERLRPPYNTTAHSNTLDRPEWLEPHMQVILTLEAQPQEGPRPAPVTCFVCNMSHSCLCACRSSSALRPPSRQPSTRP